MCLDLGNLRLGGLNWMKSDFFFPFSFAQTALLCTVVTEVAFFLDYYLVTTILHYVFSIFIPIYPLIGCLICFIKVRGHKKSSPEHL